MHYFACVSFWTCFWWGPRYHAFAVGREYLLCKCVLLAVLALSGQAQSSWKFAFNISQIGTWCYLQFSSLTKE